MECFYCGNLLEETNASKEHIIQNALGGILESTKICCKKCNNFISKKLDVPFCAIFAPVVTQIDDMNQTNPSSRPSCEGKAICTVDHQLYDVVIKGKQIIDCVEYKRKYRSNISKTELNDKFKIVGYNFNLNNADFKNGICKIALNYAIECGVNNNVLKSNINISRDYDEILDIDFKFPIIPFYPLNAFDSFLELDTPFELSHSLILFNIENVLICFVDLFNTFQFYVVLSTEWCGREMYHPFYQVIEKIDRSMPEFNIYRAKHVYTLATIYGVKPDLNVENLRKDIATVIKKVPYKKSIGELISKKISWQYSRSSKYDTYNKYKSITFYLDDNESLREGRYKRFSPDIESNNACDIYAYPIRISDMLSDGLNINEYSNEKFKRLVTYLLNSQTK
ncbi:HNH endonuclease [Candidatus Parcubacteria bacterium]|jgi:hypothetical protein|nr:MAG: HNH endonuclease [Candidatus Parcubacteria bacterium]